MWGKLFTAKKHESSFRDNMMTALSILAASLLAAVILFDWYTLQEQQKTISLSHNHALSIYRAQIDNAMLTASDYLTASSVNTQFLSLSYARTRTEAYAASVQIADQCRILMKSQQLLSMFFTYSSEFDYCHSTYTDSVSDADSYSHSDLMMLRDLIRESAESSGSSAHWIPVALSDRTVFLSSCVYHRTVFAAVVDPARHSFADLEPGSHIFYSLADGSLCYPSAFPFSSPINLSKNLRTEAREIYSLTVLPLSLADGYICYATPSISFWRQLNRMQQILLLVTFFLLGSVPLCWIALRKRLLVPVKALTDTLQEIQSGNTGIRVSQSTGLQEANEIASIVNTMLDAIQQQKIESYEYRLKIQQAQLQYLQVQIRPHFFLNCLNQLYSMAEKEKYAPIQELVLDLSVYLRATFKNSTKLILLQEEIHSVNSYVHIQQLGMELSPQIKVDVDADMVRIPVPPLCILSFVENSIKHSALLDVPLKIHIKCRKLPGDGADFLNITISDNCGGIPAEKLDELNHPIEEIYNDQNVGTSNVRQRLKLLYHDKAALTFQNHRSGACVDLFIPIPDEVSADDIQ